MKSWIHQIKFLALLFTPIAVFASEVDWLYREPVTYISQHDPARIKIAAIGMLDLDPHPYQTNVKEIVYFDQHLRYDNVSKWEAGRELQIAYSASTGSVLLDPESGKFVEIISGLSTHPIDAIHRHQMEHGNTAEHAIAADRTVKLWKQEIARIYRMLKLRFPAHTKELDHAEQNWLKHCQSDLEALSCVTDKSGTIHIIHSYSDRLILHRVHALRITRWGRQ